MRRWALLLLLMFAPSAFGKNVIAVHYFDTGSTGEYVGLKVGLAQMLSSDLLNVEGRTYDVVERSQLQKVLDELELGRSGAVDKSTAAKVGKLLGVRYFVFGVVTGFGGTMMINARVVDVETGIQVAAYGAHGPQAEFLRLEHEVAQKIGAKLMALPEFKAGDPTDVVEPDPAPKQIEPAQKPAPPSKKGRWLALNETTRAAVTAAGPALFAPDPNVLEAAAAYSDGLIFMDAGEDVKARERFQSALASKPNLAHAKSALAALEI